MIHPKAAPHYGPRLPIVLRYDWPGGLTQPPLPGLAASIPTEPFRIRGCGGGV